MLKKKEKLEENVWIDQFRDQLFAEALRFEKFNEISKGIWFRWNGWRGDEVRLSKRHGGISYSLSYAVRFPPLPEFGPDFLDYLSLETAWPCRLLGKKDDRGLVPQSNRLRGKIIRRNIQDVRLTMGWFDERFKNPETAISVMNSLETITKGSEHYNAMLKYLELVKINKHQDALLELRENCSDYTRKYFSSIWESS